MYEVATTVNISKGQSATVPIANLTMEVGFFLYFFVVVLFGNGDGYFFFVSFEKRNCRQRQSRTKGCLFDWTFLERILSCPVRGVY